MFRATVASVSKPTVPDDMQKQVNIAHDGGVVTSHGGTQAEEHNCEVKEGQSEQQESVIKTVAT